MKFNSHGTYMRPNIVVETAAMPARVFLETNCRTHSPSTKRIRKTVSKSLARDGLSWMPSLPVQCRKVPAISSTPPATPNERNRGSPVRSASP
jgi:hypothetical protein